MAGLKLGNCLNILCPPCWFL